MWTTERTAVTGISWGGYLTCIVAGLDQRFKLAMPVYGCGFLHENSAWVAPQFDPMTPERRAKWISLWDPSRYIGAATMPVVFLNGTNDFAYPLDSYAKTCRLVRGTKHFSIQLQMPHGHIFDFPEFFLFVDQYLQGRHAAPGRRHTPSGRRPRHGKPSPRNATGVRAPALHNRPTQGQSDPRVGHPALGDPRRQVVSGKLHLRTPPSGTSM